MGIGLTEIKNGISLQKVTMKTFSFSLICLVLLTQCQQNSKQNTVQQKPKSQTKQSFKPVANASMAFQVEGMVCKMGCGGAIRKELLESGAVTRVDVAFVEEAKSQEIVAYYDSTKIQVEGLKKILETTNDGQFKVIRSYLPVRSK